MSTITEKLSAALKAGGCRCGDDERRNFYHYFRAKSNSARCYNCAVEVGLDKIAIDSENRAPAIPIAGAGSLTYKTHFCLGVHKSRGVELLGHWPYAPSRKEIDARLAVVPREDYLQFAVVNPTGLVDAIEKPEEPLWTTRT